MTAVDTRWITDENPMQQHADRNPAQGPPPLEHVDAAMRVLDHVLTGVVDSSKRVFKMTTSLNSLVVLSVTFLVIVSTSFSST